MKLRPRVMYMFFLVYFQQNIDDNPLFYVQKHTRRVKITTFYSDYPVSFSELTNIINANLDV